jgi:hypothetical protein
MDNSENENGQFYGSALANAGDVNNDGYQDLAVGAYGWTYDSEYSGKFANNGMVAVFSGAANFGWNEFYVKKNAGTGTKLAGDKLGWAVAGVGDVDGDGYDDIAVSEPKYNGDLGRVQLIFGGSSNMYDDVLVYGSESNGHLGQALAGLGTIQWPGSSSTVGIAMGMPYAQLNATEAGGFWVVGQVNRSAGTASYYSADGSTSYGHLGYAFAALGNGTWAVGQPGATTGSVWVMQDANIVANSIDSSVFTTKSAPQCGVALGSGDTDGDGLTDIVIGCNGAGAFDMRYTTSTVPSCGVLNAGSTLWHGQTLSSCDGRFALVMQNDGNLVLYQSGTPLWATGTNGMGGYDAVMQNDGNLVVYTQSGTPLWASNTVGDSGAWLDLQDDGDLVIYQNGIARWSSGTCCH